MFVYMLYCDTYSNVIVLHITILYIYICYIYYYDIKCNLVYDILLLSKYQHNDKT